ncbi:MAG: hypothetical protein J6K89_06845 [Oscillospiraceae bacterium]|nr:hypothetical protein [Oscillospiraceae bacterium]
MEEKNMEKYQIYKDMMENLKKAMTAGFYYQAIFIEYAILEDRFTSALRCAGVKYLNKNGREIDMSYKLGKLRGNAEFAIPYVRKRLPLELLDEVEAWKKERDKLIHNLAKIPYNDKAVEAVAVKGQDLVKLLDNRIKSVNNYYKKQHP